MDASGNILWAVNAGGVAGSTTQLCPLDVTSDAFGNVFVSGFFSTGSGSASAQFGSEILTSIGTSDHFVSQLDGATGQFLESWRMGGPLIESNVGGLTVDAAGNLWMTGQFYGAADFPTGDTLNSVNDSGDIFVLRFLQSPPAAMSATAWSVDANDNESIQSLAQTNSLMQTEISTTTSSSQLLAVLPESGTSTKRSKNDISPPAKAALSSAIDAALEELEHGPWPKIVAEIALAIW